VENRNCFTGGRITQGKPNGSQKHMEVLPPKLPNNPVKLYLPSSNLKAMDQSQEQVKQCRWINNANLYHRE
jgi:hypothetical protein